MRHYTKENLIEAVKNSYDWTDVCKRLGRIRSSNILKPIRRFVSEYGINISHFDSNRKTRQRRIHPIIEKECPVCKIKFKDSQGDCREKTYCSYKCCNSLRLGKRHSRESRRKTSATLHNKWIENGGIERMVQKRLLDPQTQKIKIVHDKVLIEKTCPFCKKEFLAKNSKNIFCSASCSGKAKWENQDYRKKIISSLRASVVAGTHKGWRSRNILSYPEKFFKKVLELNGFKGKFVTNHPVKKRDLGIDCDANYFLDFYFPCFNLDLEIDGKQHEQKTRKESDIKRDLALTNYGCKIYRIKWKSLNSVDGKIFIKNEIEKLLKFLSGGTGVA